MDSCQRKAKRELEHYGGVDVVKGIYYKEGKRSLIVELEERLEGAARALHIPVVSGTETTSDTCHHSRILGVCRRFRRARYSSLLLLLR